MILEAHESPIPSARKIRVAGACKVSVVMELPAGDVTSGAGVTGEARMTGHPGFERSRIKELPLADRP
jgi:hypothetical protein